MRRVFKLNLIILMLIAGFIFCNKTYAAVLSSQDLVEKIKESVSEQIQQNTKQDLEIDVKINSLPYKTMNVPEGKLEIKTSLNSKYFNSSTIVKVKILIDNDLFKTFGARVDLKVYDDVWVTTERIKKGEVLTDLVLEKRNIGSLLNKVVDKDFDSTNYLTTRVMKSGAVIKKESIERIPDIMKGSVVSVIFKTPLVSVVLPAEAITNGYKGGFIKVKNKKYNKKYIGKVIGANLILVNI